jgi:DnaJ-domain-containing protein 1
MPMPKGSSNSWIDLAFKTATKFGRGVYVAFREGEAEVWNPAPKAQVDEPGKWWEILGVPPSASKEEIQSAYRRLMQKHHPDKAAHLSESMQLEAEQEAKRLNDAYEKALRQG